jgi:hypothetical protein
LSQEPARNTLALWISAARKRLRKPYIWFLTGIYVLDDARTFASSTREPEVSAGISSATVTALTGVPLGGSIEISHNVTLSTDMIVNGNFVWAAQYQRLKINFFWPWEEITVLQSVPLYNTFSTGVAYSSANPKTYRPPDRATLSLIESGRSRISEDVEHLDHLSSWTESESEAEVSDTED